MAITLLRGNSNPSLLVSVLLRLGSATTTAAIISGAFSARRVMHLKEPETPVYFQLKQPAASPQLSRGVEQSGSSSGS